MYIRRLRIMAEDQFSIPVNRQSVDFLNVPQKNVVDLRPQMPEVPAGGRKASSRTRTPFRKAAKFFGIALLVTLPIAAASIWQWADSVKGDVLGESTEAYHSMERAAEALSALDGHLASEEFSKAEDAFTDARSGIKQANTLFQGIADVLPIASKLKSGDALLAAGEHIASAGEHIATMLAPLVVSSTPETEPTQTIASVVSALHEESQPILDDLDAAATALRNVKSGDLPEEYQATFSKIEGILPELQEEIRRSRLSSEFLLDLLGTRKTKRYLMLFQNNLELRASGGFLGSLALVDVANGTVTKLEVPSGGTYDYQGQLSERVIAPEPLHLVNPHWQLQDANWWPDFPTSAKKVLWFYEKSGGPTVDGVIAMTPELLVRLLQVTGPIDMTEKYGVVIDADNVISETLLAIDAEKEGSKPKQIIGDLLPRILDTLFTAKIHDQLSVLATFGASLNERHLMFFFPDVEKQQQNIELGWGGAIIPAVKDYLMVADTNIGGGKTDGVIDETIEHRADIKADGTVEVTVSVTRTHHGDPSDKFTGTRNVDYMRFYVPKGSVLKSATGFERIDPKRFQLPDEGYVQDELVRAVEGNPIIDAASGTFIGEQFGKTVFANWVGVGPGEAARVSMSYTLPFRLNVKDGWWKSSSDTYSVLFQKQPGTTARFLVSNVSFPDSYAVERLVSHADDIMQGEGSIDLTTPLDLDQAYGVVFSPKK